MRSPRCAGGRSAIQTVLGTPTLRSTAGSHDALSTHTGSCKHAFMMLTAHGRGRLQVDALCVEAHDAGSDASAHMPIPPDTAVRTYGDNLHVRFNARHPHSTGAIVKSIRAGCEENPSWAPSWDDERSSSAWAVTAATVAVGAAAALYMRRRKVESARASEARRVNTYATVELTWFERTVMGGEEPMTTVTFFEGACPEVAPYIRTRLQEIFALSPWVGGFLADGRCYYDETGAVNATHLYVCTAGEVNLSRRTPLAEMSAAVAPFIVQKGFPGPESPIFRLTLIPDALAPSTRFALVASMSHVVADGQNFYQLHNMLSQPVAPSALDALRRPAVDDAKLEALGGREYWAEALRMLPSMLLGVVRAKLRRQPASVVAFHVDGAAIHAAKARAQAEGGAAFVSTNDILTSWVVSAGGFGVGLMPINFRGRVRGAEAHLAGNYEAPLLLGAADAASPQLVRASLQQMRRAASDPPTPLPGMLEHVVRGLRIGVCTNWAAFCEPLQLPGAAYDLHLPVFDLHRSGFGDNKAMCVVFRPKAEVGVACMILAGSNHLLEWLPSRGSSEPYGHGLVGAPIP